MEIRGKSEEKSGGEKRGEKKTRIGDVKSLMETMTLTVDQALDALKIQGKERADAKKDYC